MKTQVILSEGLGVESTAILVRWMKEPETRPCDLSDLIVITAMTGDEYPDTKTDFETHILPMLREHGVRYVQVARAGHLEEAGIVVLDDSRDPKTLFVQGVYKLSDELAHAGTLPQSGGEHRCAMKFKAFVIEKWLEDNIYAAEEIHHAFGYNAEETKRVVKSQEAIARRNEGATPVIFGFNSEEPKRAARAAEYDTQKRVGVYPLVEWGWNRQACFDYLQKHLGVLWKKSACVYCPFNNLKEDGVNRMKQFPAEVAKALVLERVSLALNHRSTLYATKALADITEKTGMDEARKSFDVLLNEMPWSLYRVRRIYKKKGQADRLVERLENGPRTSMELRVREKASEFKATLDTRREIEYAFVRERQDDTTVYPALEDFYVACPGTVDTKSRYGTPYFEKNWNKVLEAGAQ